jgi:hypothetical protein
MPSIPRIKRRRSISRASTNSIVEEADYSPTRDAALGMTAFLLQNLR